jgi:thymidylate kinase
MGKVIVVTSGKGGVGKTTSTAALGAALARAGQKVVVVDFDVGLRNLDLVMGAERRVVHDLINVVQGVVKLAPALIRDKRVETLFLLAASQTRDKDALTEEGVGRVIACSRSCRSRCWASSRKARRCCARPISAPPSPSVAATASPRAPIPLLPGGSPAKSSR